MALRTIKGAADQKGKPAFLHFEKPASADIRQDFLNLDLNKIMQNIGGEAFTYETFKNAYDSDPRVKEMVGNFNAKGAEVKSKEDTGSQMQGAPGDDKVSQMAKSATDLGKGL